MLISGSPHIESFLSDKVTHISLELSEQFNPRAAFDVVQRVFSTATEWGRGSARSFELRNYIFVHDS